jgi:FAD/FMN-containing dehydrogenase
MCPQTDMDRVKNEITSFIKEDKIVDDPQLLKEYARDQSPMSGSEPQLLVYPQNKGEVQRIVKLARDNKIPLVPVSSAPPHFRGDTVPEQSGIIIDFSKMKKIFKIDPVNRYVMLEPGVTFGELIPELKKQGLKLNMPLLPRSTKSVIASQLEREPVIIPKYQYDYTDPIFTLEIVYGTGDDFRTGSASGPGPLENLKADKVNPWGPGSIDFARFVSAAQGTMGLITWAVSKVEIQASLQKLYFIPAEDIEPLAATVNKLLSQRVVDECLILNRVNLAAILAENFEANRPGLEANLPAWTGIVCVAGYQRHPEERAAIQSKYLREICLNLGLHPDERLPGAEGKEQKMLELLSSPWEKEPYWKLRAKGACQEIFFLAPISKSAEYIDAMKAAAAQFNYPASQLGCYVQPLVQGRGSHIEFNLFYDKSNPAETANIGQLFGAASRMLFEKGAYFSRPYGIWADMVYDASGEEVQSLRKLKKIFDPENILNPGKLCF